MSRVDRIDPKGSARASRSLRLSARRPAVDSGRCTGCGRCVAACDRQLLGLEAVRWQKFSVLHDPQRCTGCGACVVACPFDAITLRPPAPDAVVDGAASDQHQPPAPGATGRGRAAG